MRVVLDTNVLISAILFGGLPRHILRQAINGDFRFATSPHLLDEMEEVLHDRFTFSRRAAVETRAELEAIAELFQPESVPTVCRDPDDNEVLAVAVCARAACIVTGDRDLLDIGTYEGVAIMSPAAFARGTTT